jgi:hypothetical protein
VAPLETLFRLEIDYHRRLRTLAPCMPDAASLHTSYALQFGYDRLIHAAGPATARDVETLRERLTLVGDTRDVLAARDSVKQLLNLCQPDT